MTFDSRAEDSIRARAQAALGKLGISWDKHGNRHDYNLTNTIERELIVGLAEDVLAALERERALKKDHVECVHELRGYIRELQAEAHGKRPVLCDHKDSLDRALRERNLLRVRLEALVEAAELHFVDGHGDDPHFWGDSLRALRAALDAARVEKEG